MPMRRGRAGTTTDLGGDEGREGPASDEAHGCGLGDTKSVEKRRGGSGRGSGGVPTQLVALGDGRWELRVN